MRSILFICLSILCTDQLTNEYSIQPTIEYSIQPSVEYPKIQEVESFILKEDNTTNKYQLTEKTVKISNLVALSISITPALGLLFYSIYNLVIEYTPQ